MSCPTVLNYSYLANNIYTAYSTDRFNYDGLLQVNLVFQNNSDRTFILSMPQVWTTEGLPPEPYGETGFPPLQLENIPLDEIKPGDAFAIKGTIDLSKVKSGDKYLTIRPQVVSGGSTGDVSLVPVLEAEFICLPEK